MFELRNSLEFLATCLYFFVNAVDVASHKYIIVLICICSHTDLIPNLVDIKGDVVYGDTFKHQSVRHAMLQLGAMVTIMVNTA